MRIITIILIIFQGHIAFSQDRQVSLSLQLSNPINNNQVGWFEIDGESFDGFNVKNNSFAIGALISYNKSEYCSMRFRFGYTKLFMREFGGYSNGITYDSTHVGGKQNQLSFAPGIVWNINNNKFKLFGGFELPYTYYGDYTLDFLYQQTDVATNNVLYLGHSLSTIPHGFSIGIGGLYGFNYQLSDLFSIGAEFSPSLFYYSLGGQTHAYDISAPDIIYYTKDKNSGVTGFQNRFSINLTFNLIDK